MSGHCKGQHNFPIWAANLTLVFSYWSKCKEEMCKFSLTSKGAVAKAASFVVLPCGMVALSLGSLLMGQIGEIREDSEPQCLNIRRHQMV